MQAGHHKAAKDAYERVLRADPDQPDALHLLGVLAHREGDDDKATPLLRRAVELRPTQAEFHYHYGLALRDAGRLEWAIGQLEAALALHPAYTDAWNDLAATLAADGRLDEAEAACRRALTLEPRFAAAHLKLGDILMRVERSDEAASAYREALRLHPQMADAHCSLGAAHEFLEAAAEAEASYRQALEVDPGHPPSLARLCGLLLRRGDHESASRLCHEALAARPGSADAFAALGDVLTAKGDPAAAAAAFERAAELRPQSVAARMRLGDALLAKGEANSAATAFDAALALDPRRADGHIGRGRALETGGQPDDAATAYRRAAEIAPGHHLAWAGLGRALRTAGASEEAEAAYRRAVALRPDDPRPHSELIAAMNADSRYRAAEVEREGERWDALHAAPLLAHAAAHTNRREAGRRLRVGYLAPDFADPALAAFVEPLLAAHDRRAVAVHCYSDAAGAETSLSRLIRGWCVCASLDDCELAARVRRDGIDILVDLTGHGTGGRRLLFARRPAPIQASWLGEALEAGATAVRYRLSDAVVDPAGPSRLRPGAKVLRLPHGFLCFAPPLDAPAATAPPVSANGYVTFGVVGPLQSVSPAAIACWARLLEEVSGARLLLANPMLRDPATRQGWLDRLVRAGADPARLEFSDADPKGGDYGVFDRIDVVLDTFPANGTAGLCLALWMGAPVVTLAGDRPGGRRGASILSRLDLDRLAAASEADYVDTAAALARGTGRLIALRRQLRPRMADSPLVDADAFARDVEAAYREMWLNWIRSPE